MRLGWALCVLPSPASSLRARYSNPRLMITSTTATDTDTKTRTMTTTAAVAACLAATAHITSFVQALLLLGACWHSLGSAPPCKGKIFAVAIKWSSFLRQLRRKIANRSQTWSRPHNVINNISLRRERSKHTKVQAFVHLTVL